MKELIELFAEKVGRYPRGNVQDELRSWAANEITTLRQKLAESEARVVELEGLIYRKCEHFILRKQAEAFEDEAKRRPGSLYSTCLKESAQRLRQQADEAERAGGEK